MASTNEIVAWTAAIATPLGTGAGFFLNWLLRKRRQDADIQTALDNQTAQIESSIADKYSDRITKLEGEVKELFSALVNKAGEVGELRGQVLVLKEQLAAVQKDRDDLHLQMAALQTKVDLKAAA